MVPPTLWPVRLALPRDQCQVEPLFDFFFE